MIGSRLVPLALALLVASIVACDDDNDNGGGAVSPPSADAGGPSKPSASADGIDEAVLAKCASTSILIETTEWVSCLAGKRVSGTEPFNGQSCELRIGANGAFEYLRGGAVAITLPERSGWGDASGTYQNEGEGDRRIFLASVAPSLPAVEGQARVTDLTLGFFGLASQTDTVEIKYLDAALTRQTFNCTVDVR